MIIYLGVSYACMHDMYDVDHTQCHKIYTVVVDIILFGILCLDARLLYALTAEFVVLKLIIMHVDIYMAQIYIILYHILCNTLQILMSGLGWHRHFHGILNTVQMTQRQVR